VVHVASSRRSHGSEAKDGWFDGVGCGAVEVKLKMVGSMVAQWKSD
jgi:hypothetical protein